MRPGKHRKRWRQGTRLSIKQGHMHGAANEPAVIIIDNKTGNVTPISAEAAFSIADQLVDQAEQLERKNQ